MKWCDDFTSRFIRLIAYDEAAQTLYLWMIEDDAVLEVASVQRSRYVELVASPSKSHFVNTRVRPFHPVRMLSPREQQALEDQLYRRLGENARSQVLTALDDPAT